MGNKLTEANTGESITVWVRPGGVVLLVGAKAAFVIDWEQGLQLAEELTNACNKALDLSCKTGK